jgi:hypothetical protein
MSTRIRKPRCAVCRNVLPEEAKTNKCGPCRGQTVLFPLRAARSLTRPVNYRDGAR